MSPRNKVFTGLFLILALILTIQPASAATQSYLDPGYRYDIGSVASGGWQVYDLDIKDTDDYDILTLVYSHAFDFDLYVYDPANPYLHHIGHDTIQYREGPGLHLGRLHPQTREVLRSTSTQTPDQVTSPSSISTTSSPFHQTSPR